MSIENEIKNNSNLYFQTVSREQFIKDLKRAGFEIIDGNGKIIFTEPNEDDHVYCTCCKWFKIGDEDIPYCPYESECNIWDCEDSKPYKERPKYEYQK